MIRSRSLFVLPLVLLAFASASAGRAMTPPDADCSDGQCVFAVTAPEDDAGVNPAGCAYNPSGTTFGRNEIYFGRCTEGPLMTGGFRFRDVRLPQGAPILRAWIEFTVDGPYQNVVSVEISGEAADNAQPFSESASGTQKPSDRVRTAASSVWLVTSPDPWTVGEIRQTPDVTAAVQEVVSRPGWQSGNALAVIFRTLEANPSVHRRVFAFEREDTAAHTARLIVVTGSAHAFGADTSTHPERGEFPPGTRTPGMYDFYAGRIGSSLWPCYVLDQFGHDPFGIAEADVFDVNKYCKKWPTGVCDCPAFQYRAAQAAEEIYAYWTVTGPLGRPGSIKTAYDYGVAQAQSFLEAFQVYAGLTLPGRPDQPVVSGRTLFVDIEEGTGATSSWYECKNGGETCKKRSGECAGAKGNSPKETELCLDENRQMLNGLLDTLNTIVPVGDTWVSVNPGVYTRPNIWTLWFGASHRPSRPFVLWITGCFSSCQERTEDEVISTFQADVGPRVMGGMSPVVWQYRVGLMNQQGQCGSGSIVPDYDFAPQDPAGWFTPIEAPAGAAPFCPCDRDVTCP